MIRTRLTMALILGCLGWLATATAQESRPIEVRKIWDQGNHNAFTDLVRFGDRWFCVFREGKGHVSPDGGLRVITSLDGETWESAALLTSPTSDLRDPKISITPDNRLMLCAAEALHVRPTHSHQSLVWFSGDGYQWGDKHEIGDPNFWLWRVTWHGDKAYGVGYDCGPEPRSVRLYSSADGKQFETLVPSLLAEGYPNETAIAFAGDTAHCLLRRDGKPNTGLLGTAEPPYTEWTWQDLGVRIGGPHMIRLPDGRFVAAVRLYDGGARTSLCWVDPEQGSLTEFQKLPSGGDTSYAGLVFHDDLLWVSYYSSHEGKTEIYLAKVALPGPTIDIGSRRELFVDDFLVDRNSGWQSVMQTPQPQEVALVCDAPWEGNTSAYYAIFADDDRYRMYYRGAHWDVAAKKATHPEVTCYAESRDGITWTKPNLGLFEFAGSKENNIVWAGDSTHNFTPLKDPRPDCPPEAKYKALAGAAIRWNGEGLIAFQSPDGLHWSRMRREPVITDGDFDSQNLALWHQPSGRFLAYHRKFRDGVRDIMVSSSTDFLNWTEPQYLKYGDAPEEQLYTNAVQPYLRAPHLLVGFPTRFQPANQQVEPVLMTSRDGQNFRRWPEPLITIDAPQDRDGNRSNYMTWGLLSLPDRPRELSVYATEAYYEGPGSRVRRFTFRADGFVALQAGETEAELLTKPLTFDGERLLVNFKTAAADGVRVELQDAAGRPIPGFTLADCVPLVGDEIDQPVRWASNDSVAALAGKPIRIRFVGRNADLYAFAFAR
jgi:hypothetical protein